MSIFSNRMHNEMVDGKPIKLMEFLNDEFPGTMLQVAKCAELFTWLHGVQTGAPCRMVLCLMHGLPQSHLVCIKT